MGNTTIMGKPSNTIGAPNSQLILRGSSIKILWGNKFIDLVKNGKLASDKSDILKTVSSSDDINSNGIYLIPETNEVWVSIDGTKVNLAGEVGTTYVSFLAEQKEVTADLKYTALTNAGLYYETLEEAQQAGIKAGIIFIVGENKLYLANNGLLSEYNIFSTSSSETEGTSLDELTIKDLKIYNDGMNMIISSPSLQFNINKKLALDLNSQIKSYLDVVMQSGTYIQSSNATSTTGYRLYVKNGKSVLEVDSLIWRDKPVKDTTKLNNAIIYSLHGNIILSAELEETNIICKLKYLNSFPSTGKVYIAIPLNILILINYELNETETIVSASIEDIISPLDIVVQILYTADGVKSSINLTIPAGNSSASYTLPKALDFTIDTYNIISGPSYLTNFEVLEKGQLLECDIINNKELQITISVDSSILNVFLANCTDSFICLSNVPLIKILQNNIDILDRSKTITNESNPVIDETIHTRIGIVKESDFESLKTCPEKLLEVLVGIYSDNFIGLNSKLYDTIFKKRCDYPKYDETITIPEDYLNEKYNLIIPNIGWIRELLKLTVPKGTIAMFNGGSEIPEGWAVCDGNNGTPNLVGKFIKAVASTDLVGDNDTVLNESNELTITLENLPKHSHPHKEHTHSLSGTLSGTTGTSGNLTIPLKLSDYNWGITSSLKTFITSATGEGITTETGTVDSVSNIKTLGGDVVGGDHSHSISLNIAEGTSISSTTSEELILEDAIWTNKPIKIEPRSYSLIFIMKL